MRVAGVERLNDPVRILEVAERRPLRRGEVLIEVRAAGVGNWDELVRTGGWDVGVRPPAALGVEAAGVITDLGPGVEDWSPGREVLTHPVPLSDQGTWAPRLIASADLVAAKPQKLAWPEAGAFPVPALTAIQVIDEALGLSRGQHLFVHGAGSVTGELIVALGVLRGLRVLATAGSSSQARVKAAGAQTVVDYRDTHWPSGIRAAAGGGVDGAANAVRGGAGAALATVRNDGRLATITSDPPPAERGISVKSVYVRPDAAQLATAAQALAVGELQIRLGGRFALHDAPAALRYAIEGRGGAVVLEP